MIRKANENDWVEVYDLIVELENYSFPQASFKDIYIKNIQDKKTHYFVKEFKKKIIGFVSILISTPLHHCATIAEIQELIVTKKYRNAKIGKELINLVEQLAKEKGWAQIEIASNIKRLQAHNFYIANHFPRSHFKFVKKIIS